MATAPGYKFPLPDPFDGKSDDLSGGSKAREFMDKCEVFFSKHSGDFGNAEDKVRFTFMLLKDAAWPWAAALIPALSNNTHAQRGMVTNWATFKMAFLAQFSSVDQKAATTRELVKLKQTGKVSQYAAQFRELASQTEWNDDSKIAIYHTGLRGAIQHIISTSVTIPTTYEEYVNWTIQIGDRLDALSASKPQFTPSGPRKPNPGQTQGSRGQPAPA